MTKNPNEIPILPYAKLGIIALNSVKDIAQNIDKYIVKKRQERLHDYMQNGLFSDDTSSSYLVTCEFIRFADGEGKCTLLETVRGKDIYILADIGNYSCKYKMFGMDAPMGPDEHLQDIKRAVSAIAGKAKRVTVIMPRLYSSRQDRRNMRESLDCAMALQDLERLGVKNILTFDAHSSKVQNAIPNCGFENLYSIYNLIEEMVTTEEHFDLKRENLVSISPDSGGVDRAIFYATVLNCEMGMFYKRRDYKTVIDGTNPITDHEYLGPSLKGKDVIIVDDMIASGKTMFDLMTILKQKGANRIFISVSFAMFTKGIQDFERYYQEGLFERIYTTNLSYIPEEIVNKDWIKTVDMSRFIGKLINMLNYDMSLEEFLDEGAKIKQLINSIRA